ncbi:disease resistance protein [Trifolium repens]|nr:disease resistance protein [Trifolium repens]
MGNIISDLVKSNVEKLIDGAIGEARYVFCLTCIVKEFEQERDRLKQERINMVQRVKEAKERDKDIQANVGSWLEETDELNQVDTKTKQTCFFGFCPDCIWRYKKGKELADKVTRIKELKEKGEKLENIELSRPLPGVEQYSSKDYISFKSREEKYKELLEALKDDKNYITGLQGMGGTGKTTLAIQVGKELKQSEQFAYVVVTTVSFTPDVKKIQDDIAGSLNLKWDDCNEADRPKKLWSRLTNGDKILVILDDVWDGGPSLDFDAIGIPKLDNHNGCSVLVTSRSKDTFYKMDCSRIIELVLLSEEEAWNMFKRYAGISDSFPKKLIDKGRKIAKECKQLPVAISAIASSLKGHQHREQKWDRTLKSLKNPGSMGGVDRNLVGIYNCFKISYDNLMDAKVQRLFLLCSVFREDEKISIEVLTRLCIGVGLLGEDYGSYDDARNQVVEAKEKLIDSCLLLEVGEKHLRMHDLVRDAAQMDSKQRDSMCKIV